MLFDIRNQAKACETLERITSIPFSVWEKESTNEKKYDYLDDFILATTQKYHTSIPAFEDLTFVFSHLTSSMNGCASIREHGLTDLARTYRNPNSELYQFIESHGIHIRLDDHLLVYNREYHDISIDEIPSQDNRTEYNEWLVGRKFYFDFCVCGFLSIDPRSRYLGCVDKRPEILQDLDNLLGLNLSSEWEETHSAYEIIAKVSGTDIICDSESKISSNRTTAYLCYAYYAAFGDCSEHVLLCKDNVSIPAENIIEIHKFTGWQNAM